METLLTGNTGYLTERFIEEAFPDDHVVLQGDCAVNPQKHMLKLRRLEGGDRADSEEYEYDRIVYFSSYLTLHGHEEGELDRLGKLLEVIN